MLLQSISLPSPLGEGLGVRLFTFGEWLEVRHFTFGERLGVRRFISFLLLFFPQFSVTLQWLADFRRSVCG